MKISFISGRINSIQIILVGMEIINSISPLWKKIWEWEIISISPMIKRRFWRRWEIIHSKNDGRREISSLKSLGICDIIIMEGEINPHPLFREIIKSLIIQRRIKWKWNPRMEIMISMIWRISSNYLRRKWRLYILIYSPNLNPKRIDLWNEGERNLLLYKSHLICYNKRER